MAAEFKSEMSPYMVGRRADAGEWNTISRTNESATAIKFGAPVQRGTGDHGVVPLSSGDFLGVAEADQNVPYAADEHRQYQTVPVMESGVIAVECSGAVVAGAPAGWNGTSGKWVAVSTAYPAIPGCEFDTSGTTTTVLLRVRRPVPAA